VAGGGGISLSDVREGGWEGREGDVICTHAAHGAEQTGGGSVSVLKSSQTDLGHTYGPMCTHGLERYGFHI